MRTQASLTKNVVLIPSIDCTCQELLLVLDEYLSNYDNQITNFPLEYILTNSKIIKKVLVKETKTQIKLECYSVKVLNND